MAPHKTVQINKIFKELTEKGKIKCIVCLAHLAYDKIIRTRTKSKHLESETHLRAMQAHDMMIRHREEKPTKKIATLVIPHKPISIQDLDLMNEIEDEGIFEGDFVFTAGHSVNDRVLDTCMAMNEVMHKENQDLAYRSINDRLDCIDEVDESTNSDGSIDDFSFEDEQTDMEDEEGWFPYTNRTLFFLDLLDNLPRLRLSDDHMKAVLWVMKECGTPNVPSFYALCKLQENLQHSFIKPKQHISSQGTEFFAIDPVDLVHLDWANPIVRRHLRIYPEITSVISEIWQGKKYLVDVPKSQLTPMWADWLGACHQHFFVDEIAQLQDGKFVVPLKWVVYQGREHAVGVYLKEIRSGKYELWDPEKTYIPCSQFSRNLPDLQYRYPELTVHANAIGVDGSQPHPVRTLAKGRPAFCVRLLAWTDDVSGNRSKQYNAHMNLYFASANVPFCIRAQESFVRFSSTSPDVSALEQLNAFVENLQGQWHEAFDCQLKQEIVFQIHAHLFSGDNPMQAELCSNMGSLSRFWCRFDMSGGTKEERETDKGYNALYQPGEMRQPSKTVDILKSQLQTAANGVQAALDRLQREIGIKDSIATQWCSQLIVFATAQHHIRIESETTRDPRLNQKLRPRVQKQIKDAIKADIREEAMQWLFRQPPERYDALPESEKLTLRAGDHFNVLLELPGIDIHRDAPVEILHTVLLGIDKYLWYETSHKWNPQKDLNFSTALSKLSTDGLSIRSFRPRYMVQYKNSLIGRDFKILQQIGIFPLLTRLSDANATLKEQQLFQLWRVTGEFGALIWAPEITDMDQYLVDVDTAVNNVLDCWGTYDPARIQHKYKLHVLTHLTDNISWFGPPILYATEIFEAWNGVFRYCSILSNHQSPSRDIAETLAGMERVKHFVSGGWWSKADSDGSYVSAGEKVLGILQDNKSLSRRLGFGTSGNSNPGTVKQVATATQKPRLFKDYIGDMSCEIHIDEGLIKDQMFLNCEYLTSQNNDICKRQSWVFYSMDQLASTTPCAGCIYEIITCKSTSVSDSVILIKGYDVLGTRHEQLGMPMLTGTSTIDVVCSKMVLFNFNAQKIHNIAPMGSGQPPEHRLGDLFVINTHAIHNSHLIRHTLSPVLTKPIPLYDEATRLEKHNEWASGLRVTGPAK